MSIEDNKALAQRLYDAFNRRAIDALDELTTLDCIDHTAGAGQRPGRAGLKDVWSSMFGIYPTIRATVLDILAEDDKVAARVMFEGLPTPNGGAMMLEIIRVSGGRVVELWNIIKET